MLGNLQDERCRGSYKRLHDTPIRRQRHSSTSSAYSTRYTIFWSTFPHLGSGPGGSWNTGWSSSSTLHATWKKWPIIKSENCITCPANQLIRIRIRNRVKSWIRIRIRVKSWICIRIEVKIQEFQNMWAVDAHNRDVEAQKGRRFASLWWGTGSVSALKWKDGSGPFREKSGPGSGPLREKSGPGSALKWRGSATAIQQQSAALYQLKQFVYFLYIPLLSPPKWEGVSTVSTSDMDLELFKNKTSKVSPLENEKKFM